MLCAQFAHFLPHLRHFGAPNHAVTACRVHSSRISYHICTTFGSQLSGNRVLCAQFVHFFPYLHHFWVPNNAVTACCVHSSKLSHTNPRAAKFTKSRTTCARRHFCTLEDHKLSHTNPRTAKLTKSRTTCARRRVCTLEDRKLSQDRVLVRSKAKI